MNEALDRIVDGGVIAVLRGVDADQVIAIAEALQEGGVTAIEVTADTPGVVDLVEEVSAAFTDDETVVGAGTVLDEETARAVTLAGAEFVVSPSLHVDVVEACNRYGTVAIPGVMTPTEAVTAAEVGADLVKVFPATTLGPEHVSALRQPLGQIPLVPTGGVDLDNAAAFVEAGAAAIGVGSALVDYDAAERGDHAEITRTARRFTETVHRARQ